MPRLHSLDAARASLLLLGVLFHSAVFVYLYQEPGSFLEFVAVAFAHQILHVFRMPAFFVIAGFFAAFLASSRGARSFIRNRAARIALPLVLFWLPVTFANSWTSQGAWITGRNTFDVYPIDFQHLWFLYFLVLFSVAFVLLARVLPLEKLRVIHPAYAIVVITLALPLLPGVLNDQVELGTSSRLIPEAGLLTWYFLLFLSGAIAYHQRDRWLDFLRNRALWIMAIFGTLFMLFFFIQDTGWVAVNLIYGAASTTGSFGIIGLFLRFAHSPSKTMRFLSDASYWLYLIHLPLVFFFLFIFGVNGFGAPLTITLTSILTVAIGLISYKVLVRHTVISNLLNGKRHLLRANK